MSKNPNPNLKSDSEIKLAEHWQCDARTIRRWKKAGAPLDDERQMRKWLAGQRTLPRGTMEVLSAARRAERANAPQPPGERSVRGAGAALSRLETAEVRAHDAVLAAEASGDPFELRAAETRWLRITQGLLRYDLAVDQIRRDAGELIPRADVIAHLERFAWCLHYGLYRSIEQTCPSLIGLRNESELWLILKKTLDRLQVAALAGTDALPKWLADTLNAELSCHSPSADQTLTSHQQAFQSWVAMLATRDAIWNRADMEHAAKCFSEEASFEWQRFKEWQVKERAERGLKRAEWCRQQAAAGLPVPDASDTEMAAHPELKS